MVSNTTETDGPATADVDPVGVEAKATGSGLEPNVGGTLSSLFRFLTGIVFSVLEPEDDFVRFHAARSIVTFGILLTVGMVVGTALSTLSSST